MIGFDTSPLVRNEIPFGVRRAVRGAVSALEERGNLELVRLEPQPDDRTPLGSWRRKILPQLARSRGCTGLHSFLSSVPVRFPGRKVQTLHELPWRHGVQENAGIRHKAWASLGPLLCDRVLVPSEFVARDARKRLLPGSARLRVVPWGVGPPFQPHEPAGVVDELALERYRLDSAPFVLALGAVRAKKNLAALLHGMAERIRRQEEPLQIIISGDDTADLRRGLGLASKLGLSRWITTIGEIEEEDLPSLIRLAACVSVLSLSEGFGFPVLEAAACGTPALVAGNTAPAELLGAAGIAVDSTDAAAVADGLQRSLDERRALRPLLLEQAGRFSWEACASAIEGVWKELS